MKELRGIRTPAPQEEVERARTYEALGYARGFETTTQVAGHVVDEVLYGLPDGFFEAYVPDTLAVGPSAVAEAAKALIDPENIALVVVGDRSTIEEPVRALKVGEVKTLTVEDVMGPAPKLD
jgi:predicted Zn-dependent peptidase